MNRPTPDIPISRRGLLAGSAVLLGASAMGQAPSGKPEAKPAAPAAAQDGPFELPKLPYAEDALEPHISAKTMGFHYGKHHKGYVDKLNAAVQGQKLAEMTLEDVVREAAEDPASSAIFNSAAQAWNHAFYWTSMKPKGGGEPTGKLADRVRAGFWSFDALKKKLTEAATGQFGSGWAWLALEGDKLVVLKTGNADTPIAKGGRPLLAIDVWEHAYYLDYQNLRADYVKTFLDHLVDWDFAASHLS